MDTTEVTMGQFKKFLKSSGYDKYSPTDEHPMVFVSWHEGTFGNGVRIGMVVIRSTVFCGVVLGTTVQSTCVWLATTIAIRRMPTTAAFFVV